MALLWLHGVGDTGDGWQGQFQVKGGRCYHPTANEGTLTCAPGQGATTMWFDIHNWQPPMKPIGLDEPDPPNKLKDAIDFVHKEIEKIEKTGVPADKIVIGGFSLGGAASIAGGLSYPKPIGGIVSISGWVPNRDEISKMSAKSVPVLFCCGNRDNIIDLKLSQASSEILKTVVSDNLSYMEANRAGHFQCPQEMQAVEQFIAAHTLHS
eukprot:TRINITY_DN109464_c0_g1_i1.p1 TRINITY_DN109464_c0_g1~~TRINITY_DN109464_c0_g1_i1.p1  ORF type:complete len:217 (-),score=32.17 TRINITY_DN109464_c0_g1_i1:45-671(-)